MIETDALNGLIAALETFVPPLIAAGLVSPEPFLFCLDSWVEDHDLDGNLIQCAVCGQPHSYHTPDDHAFEVLP